MNRFRLRRLCRFAVYPLLLVTMAWLWPTAPFGSAVVDASCSD